LLGSLASSRGGRHQANAGSLRQMQVLRADNNLSLLRRFKADQSVKLDNNGAFQEHVTLNLRHCALVELISLFGAVFFRSFVA